LFAERALEFDFEPVVDALAVEFVCAPQSLDHGPVLELIQTNCTILLITLCLLVFKRCVTVDYVPNLLWRKLNFFLVFFIIVLVLRLSILLLG
jgi:hypothetical protein